MISLFLAAPALAADPITLVGIWNGDEVGIGAQDDGIDTTSS